MSTWLQPENESPPLEEIRKRAQLLVIDDHAVSFQKLLERDGYHIERWAKIENMSKLTDGFFDLILLDIHGVGLVESPQLQGLGVLQHIKTTNPTQIVVAYSAQRWSVTFRDIFAMADDVWDKDEDYLTLKGKVDELLKRRYSVGYFITKMNEILGDRAADAPRAVRIALRAIRKGSTDGLGHYLMRHIGEQVTVDRALWVIGTAITLLK